MSQFEYPIWISVLFWSIPLTIFAWLVGMWAAHEDYKKENNIKGWSDKDMNAKQIILTSILSVIVSTAGWLGGVYYGSLRMFDTMYTNVGQELDVLETKLESVSTKKIESQLDQLKQKVLNKVPSRQDVIDMSAQVDDINERIAMLALETQTMLSDLKVDVKVELKELNNTTTELTNNFESSITAQSDSVKKEFGKLYDRLDVLYKDLEKISNTIDTAKETFLGKYIIKE